MVSTSALSSQKVMLLILREPAFENSKEILFLKGGFIKVIIQNDQLFRGIT